MKAEMIEKSGVTGATHFRIFIGGKHRRGSDDVHAP
jgi:hypothetical protein